MSFPNKETQFKKGKSGNPAGRPKGSISLDISVRRILEGEDELPEAIATQALQGEGLGQAPLGTRIRQGSDKIESGDTPILHTFTLKIDNSCG